jgi:hypothetical protein
LFDAWAGEGDFERARDDGGDDHSQHANPVTEATGALLPPPPPAGVVAARRRAAPRWGVQTGLLQAGQPAFWLYVVAIVVGLLYALLLQLAELITSPPGWLLSWVLLLLYILPVVLVIRFLDSYEREPRSMMLGAFLWGFLVAPLFAGFANDFWGVVIAKLGGADFASDWSAALTAPVVEETYKYLGIVVLYLIARAEFDDCSTASSTAPLSAWFCRRRRPHVLHLQLRRQHRRCQSRAFTCVSCCRASTVMSPTPASRASAWPTS